MQIKVLHLILFPCSATKMNKFIDNTMKAIQIWITISLLLLVFTAFLSSTSASPYYPNQSTLLQCLQTHTDSSDNKNISGILFSNSNPSYPSLLQDYVRNLRYNLPKTPKPHFIITPLKKSHVSAAVLCSKTLGFELRIRSGGHDYEGVSYTSSNPFVVLDLFNLNSVIVNIGKQSAYAMAGATLGEVYYGIWKKSSIHGFPAGVCPTVGVGGHISGGGYGNMIRKYGLSVDHVIDAEIVNANGEILDRKSMGEDLFWAIRGGGGASFGVLLSYTLNLVHVPQIVTVSRVVRFLADNATDLVYKWQFFMEKVNDDLFVRLLLQPVSVTVNANGKKVKTVRITFIFFFLGGKDRLLSTMDSEFPELGLQASDCKEMSWIESVLEWWHHYPLGTQPEVLLDRTYKSNYIKRKSDYVRNPIPKHGFELLWKKLIELGKPGLVFNPYGGRMSKVSVSETAFPHRAGILYKIQYSVTWHEGGDEAEAKYLSLIRVLYDFMTPYVSKSPRSAYLNYRDLDIGVNLNGTYEEGKIYGERYFSGNFERLVQVKTISDPDNFFKYEQSIPVWRSSGAKLIPGVIWPFMSCLKLQMKECCSNVISAVYGG